MSHHDGTGVFTFDLDDVMLWYVLTWPFWKSSISIVLGYFLVACWEPSVLWFTWDAFGCSLENVGFCELFEMHFGCSLRINAYYDLFWDILRLLIENRWNFMIYHWYGYCNFHLCLQLPIENCCDHDYHLMLLMEIWCSYSDYLLVFSFQSLV